ncbi:MAG TPA: ATP-binding protein [Mariprofundaceae bacterium]|nr:ATP-binding protein [Mariprofundaceae bacterium]
MSLKRRLIVWLIALLTVVGLLAGAISYWLASSEANMLLDHQLRQIARGVGSVPLSSTPRPRTSQSDEERENDFAIQVWGHDGTLTGTTHPGFALPRQHNEGFSHVDVNGQTWRVYTRIEATRTVQVSQWEEVRGEIATHAAIRGMLPVIVLMPLTWLLVVFAIERILKPLKAVTHAVTRRDAATLEPLPVNGVPEEIVPLIDEMNALLARLREALRSQKEFLSDAAHELRTPLTALQLQLQNLVSHQQREDTDACIDEMRRGLRRASRLVEQLLKMARSESMQTNRREAVNLESVAKSTIADLLPLAEEKGIDLGMVRNEPVTIMAHSDDIRTLIENLIDNAIRYTPSCGRVDIDVMRDTDSASVTVTDTGPGIPDELLPRVFDRFFRVAGQDIEGSGIGLAIVKAIADHEGADVIISNRIDEEGLSARVVFFHIA